MPEMTSNICERCKLGGRGGVGMVQRLQHQFAAAAFARGGTQGAVAVQNARDYASVVEAHPGAAGEFVLARDHVGPVFPMARRRQPWAVQHLVAIGAQDHGPGMAGTAQYDDGAHIWL